MRDKKNLDTSKYEVLAPAGSYECMVAAFNAGADAVYVGGSMFGARAFAGNFDTEELLQAIDYAHIRGKKLFLTVNTLLKNQEIKGQLFEYIRPLYIAGLDAVIVQDFGVLEFIKQKFPDLDIHASTQMTVTGSGFARELKALGVTRIVPARELSYGEIKDIYDNTGLEIECFVHGALCYSYSGQCLLSSLIGGRSGNRGRCAQPCRLPYDVIFENDSIVHEYPLSPKDLCTLKILPDILEAGVYSLKIEGRMKKPEYVALVTSMYRKYVDLYIAKGRDGYKVDDGDISILKDIYNRGGFTDGYYVRHNGSEIMSLKRPNHMGNVAANILKVDLKKGNIRARAVLDIDKDDVLEIFLDNDQSVYVKTENIKKNTEFVIDGNMLSMKQGQRQEIRSILNKIVKCKNIMRTRNNKLIARTEEEFLSPSAKSLIAVGGSVLVCRDVPLTIDIWTDEYNVHVEGEIPQPAGNRPATEEDVRKQIVKTGGTDFVFDETWLNITVEDGLFVSIKEINSLRRQALSELSDKILSSYRRADVGDVASDSHKEQCHSHNINAGISVLVTKKEQLSAAIGSHKVNMIYAEMDLDGRFLEDSWKRIIAEVHESGKEIYMALPYITRLHGKEVFIKNKDFFAENHLDGYLFRNMETVALFDEYGFDRKRMIFDNTIYGFNDEALKFLKKKNPYMITASYELNNQELRHLDNDRQELCVYGLIPVMITAGCVKKSYGRCDMKCGETVLKDRLGNKFLVSNHCQFCYNIIYNSKPLMLMDILKDNSFKPDVLRFNFVNETKEQVMEILGGKNADDFTRGHFKRGVE